MQCKKKADKADSSDTETIGRWYVIVSFFFISGLGGQLELP